jgi:hypothetical protein
VTDEWARKWRSVPVEQRRRVVRAVARGEAVADLRDVPLRRTEKKTAEARQNNEQLAQL